MSLIRNLNKGKANGPDDVSAHMLILCDETIAIPLKLIYEQVLATGIFPNIWKSANLTPIHKKGDNLSKMIDLFLCNQYVVKFLRKLYLTSYTINFFTANNLITKNQSGFRSGDSTTNQLLTLVNEIHESFDNRNSLEVRSVFLDISKAFDKVWHEGLNFKLKQNGVEGNVINLLGNYLSSGKQRVVINGKTSEYFPVVSGVPQGSVLGPLLFLIFINDLEIGIKSEVNFFADDTMIYSVVHNPTS